MSAATPIATLAVPTRGRTAAALEMLHAFEASVGRRLELVISDDDPTPSTAPTSRVRWFDATAKRRLVDALVAGGCDRAVVEFALLDDLGLAPSTGANRNLLQLVTLDRTVASFDDDLRPVVYAPPDASPAPQTSAGDPTEFWFFHHPDAAREFVQDLDPLEALATGLALAPRDGAPPVVAASLGTAGDPGSPNLLHWILQDGPSRARLAPDGDSYDAACRSRLLMRCTKRPTICFGQGWTPQAVAYDHRALQPPFLPVLRGQGLVYGATVYAGGAWSLVRLPCAIEHRLDAPHRHDADTELAAASSMAVASFVQFVLSSRGRPSRSTTPAAALRSVAQTLHDISCSASVFDEYVAHAIERRCHGLANLLRARLDAHHGQPASWAHDVATVLSAVDRVRTMPASWVPYDLAYRPDARALLLTIVQRFAATLAAWPDVVAVARALPPA